MDVFFEDSHSTEFALSPKHLFYCFYSSTLNNDLPIAPHWHYYIEMLYVTVGKGHLILNGDTIVLTTGDLVFILPQDVHSINALDGIDFEYAVIKFDPIILFDSSYDAFIFKNIIPVISPIKPSLKIYPLTLLPKEKAEVILETVVLFQEKPYGYEFIVKSKLMMFFYDFINHLISKDIDILGESLNTGDLSPILPGFTYIHDNFMKPITAESVALHCHLSYSYFSRQFKKVSGITFTKYLNFIRITEAERLLLNHEHSVTEIGYLVGFMDTSYFIRQFKIFKDTTPKQFLKLIEKDI